MYNYMQNARCMALFVSVCGMENRVTLFYVVAILKISGAWRQRSKTIIFERNV
jgi:hypothetical protein